MWHMFKSRPNAASELRKFKIVSTAAMLESLDQNRSNSLTCTIMILIIPNLDELDNYIIQKFYLLNERMNFLLTIIELLRFLNCTQLLWES